MTNKMTNKKFCKIHTEYYGEVVDNIKQINFISFNGEELKEYVEHCIKLYSIKEINHTYKKVTNPKEWE